MTVHGRIINGAVVLDEGVRLPEGANVTVQIEEKPASKTAPVRPTIWGKMVELAKWSETRPTNLPPDLAENHDHYLHGLPKRK